VMISHAAKFASGSSFMDRTISFVGQHRTETGNQHLEKTQ
jgi:hypothetical protein